MLVLRRSSIGKYQKSWPNAVHLRWMLPLRWLTYCSSSKTACLLSEPLNDCDGWKHILLQTRLAIEYFRRTLVVTKVPKQESFCFCIIGSTPRHIKLRCRRIQFSVYPDGSSVSVCQAPAHRQSPYLHHPRARKPGHKQPAPYQTGG